jgi:hypothetical protein
MLRWREDCGGILFLFRAVFSGAEALAQTVDPDRIFPVKHKNDGAEGISTHRTSRTLRGGCSIKAMLRFLTAAV